MWLVGKLVKVLLSYSHLCENKGFGSKKVESTTSLSVAHSKKSEICFGQVVVRDGSKEFWEVRFTVGSAAEFILV